MGRLAGRCDCLCITLRSHRRPDGGTEPTRFTDLALGFGGSRGPDRCRPSSVTLLPPCCAAESDE